jgi:hypothetical protein
LIGQIEIGAVLFESPWNFSTIIATPRFFLTRDMYVNKLAVLGWVGFKNDSLKLSNTNIDPELSIFTPQVCFQPLKLVSFHSKS